jgi:hypothetical protein
VFSIKAGECVSEGPQPLLPQQDTVEGGEPQQGESEESTDQQSDQEDLRNDLLSADTKGDATENEDEAGGGE